MNSVKIKLCGMTCKRDIDIVNRLQPEMAGFVLFFAKSRRNLSLEQADSLRQQLSGVTSVAVTVSPTPWQVEMICQAGFELLQVHGELSEECMSRCSIPILRAFNGENFSQAAKYRDCEKICGYVFDAAEPGSGRAFDWRALKEIPRDGKLLMLAGGLSHENVREAIKIVQPDVVDVSSGIELPEGGKDERLAELFVRAVRGSEV